MGQFKGYINIPVEMCYYVLKNNKFRPFQIYIYLNCIYSGKVRITKQLKLSVGQKLGLKSIRVISNNLNILLKLKWITYSKISKIYFIKGVDLIRKEYGFHSVSAVEFHVSDIIKLKSFIAAVYISYLINGQKKQRRRCLAELKKGYPYKGSSNKPDNSLSTFYPVSCIVIARKLNMSPTTAQSLKLLAEKSGYIEIKRNFTSTKIHVKHYHYYKRIFDEEIIRIKDNKLYFQSADLVRTHIHFKSRKKIETLIKG